MSGQPVDSSSVITLSARYGELDGQMGHWYATHFTNAWNALTTMQKAQLTASADSLGYLPPPGAFLYSSPIPMPAIINTDFRFGVATTSVDGNGQGLSGLVLRAAPKPAAENVAIDVFLPTAENARVTIVDAGGRMTRVLAAGTLAGGAHDIAWTGSDANGKRLPAGVYFVRLEAAHGTRSLKLTLTRCPQE